MSNELLIPETITGIEVYADTEKPERHKELIDQVKKDAKALVSDVSTEEGRAAIKSMAYKVSRSKTALDNLGKDLTESTRKTIDAINVKRKLIREELDTLRDEVREPLTTWETADEVRKTAIQERLNRLKAYTSTLMLENTPEQITKHILDATAMAKFDWQEFRDDAAEVWGRVHAHLIGLKQDREAYDAEQIELAALRKKQAEDAAELAALKAKNTELEKAAEAKTDIPNPPPENIGKGYTLQPQPITIAEPVKKVEPLVGPVLDRLVGDGEIIYPELIIGVDMADPGNSDQTCMVLRYGELTHVIPDPFARELMKYIEELKK